MPHIPIITGKELIRLLKILGFSIVRIKGSHYRLKHRDGRITTIPVHGNECLPKGLLRKIIREDLEMNLEDFSGLCKEIK
jgi:predicted RNA binding protein YcfA (HicA-like mRNA interferase family)